MTNLKTSWFDSALLLIAIIVSVALVAFVKPVSALPERPLVEPVTPTGTSEVDGQTGAGFIQLQTTTVDSTTAGLWTRIQWQDPYTQQWHFVDGWQGHFDHAGQVTWYVAPEDFEAVAAFRWVVYTNETQSETLTTSEIFRLPSHQNETITVSIDLDVIDTQE